MNEDCFYGCLREVGGFPCGEEAVATVLVGRNFRPLCSRHAAEIGVKIPEEKPLTKERRRRIVHTCKP